MCVSLENDGDEGWTFEEEEENEKRSQVEIERKISRKYPSKPVSMDRTTLAWMLCLIKKRSDFTSQKCGLRSIDFIY